MAAPAWLYLDTARLGLMSPSAQLAAGDFARLAGEGALGLYAEEFLSRGTRAIPDADSRYPTLASWRGLRDFASRLRRFVQAEAGSPVWFASRTASFMRFAAELLADRCRRILTVDTTWPSYRGILERQCRRRGCDVLTVPIRRDIRRGASVEDIVRRVTGAFRRHRCDGMFLPAISSDGIRLPIAAMLDNLRQGADVRLAVVDGSQAIAHVTECLQISTCDLYLAGCHKWLGAYQPLGIAFLGRAASWPLIERQMQRAIRSGSVDDPLLRFSNQLMNGMSDNIGETANVASLFTCHGALRDLPKSADEQASIFRQRLNNSLAAAELARRCGWAPLEPVKELRSGILLLRPERSRARKRPAAMLRGLFRKLGVAVSAYDDGLVRLSMPARRWLDGELDQLAGALRRGA
ncbi:MAG: hypothetical protein DCC68_18225 [Planctomycetota bacterium]|nr:MAG: hypothetical protein DCC68_18225 [Planctomycetota bacterium]